MSGTHPNAGLRVSPLEFAVFDNDAGIIGSAIDAETLNESLAGKLLRQCIAESDVLDLGKRTVDDTRRGRIMNLLCLLPVPGRG